MLKLLVLINSPDIEFRDITNGNGLEFRFLGHSILKDSPGDLMKEDKNEKAILNYAQARKNEVS